MMYICYQGPGGGYMGSDIDDMIYGEGESVPSDR